MTPSPAGQDRSRPGGVDPLDASRRALRRSAQKTGFTAPTDGPGLVGRRVELGWLRTRLDLSIRGRSHMIVLEGEAGIGKTRLANELLGEAAGAGMRVFSGRCYEQLALAYLPVRESLLPAVVEQLAERPELADDVEIVRRIARGVGEGTESPDERAHTRQLLALTRLMIEFANVSPTALLVDDLDWADDPTIDLVRHLLFRLEERDAPLLLLATSRGDPAARAARGLAALRREPRCASVHVGALPELEGADLARRLGVESAVAARELAISGAGNPLLIHALARDLREGRRSPRLAHDGAVLDPVAATINARLRELSEPVRAVVQAVAFLVPHCTRSHIASMTELDGAVVDSALQDAARSGVLTSEAARVVFTHPLYAHAAYEAAALLVRNAVHLRAAQVLLAADAQGEDVPMRAIAHHLLAAGPDAGPSLVAGFATRAGDEAVALAAWTEAARFYEGALAALGPDADPARAISLHRLAGVCHRSGLDLPHAVAHFDQAIALAAPLEDAPTLAELHIWRIRCLLASQQRLTAATQREPLQRLVDELEPTAPALAAECLVELSQSFWIEGDWVPAEEAAHRAMDIADRVNHPFAYARATVALSVPQWLRYDLAGSLATLTAGLERSRMATAESELTGPLFRLPLVLTWLGRLDEAEALANEACDVADLFNYPLEEGLPLAALTQIAVVRGDFDAAERHADQALLIQRLSGYDWAAGLFLPARVSACVARGRYEAARETLDAWSETGGPAEQDGVSLLRWYVDALEGRGGADVRAVPSLPRSPSVGADAWAAAMVEIARRQPTPFNLQRAHDLLRQCDERGAVVTSTLVTLVPRVLGATADLLGDEDGARRHLERAIVVGTKIGAEPEVARSQLDLALILLRRGERDLAHELFGTAGSTFARLGMRPEIDRVESLVGAAVSGLTTELRGPTAPTASRNAVILFADVVDSTRLTKELGDPRYRERAQRLEELVDATIVAHDGTVVSGVNLGDGFIGLFASAERAIGAGRQCARDAGVTGLHLHLAIHAGEIIVDGPRIFGGAVNRAARICSLTEPDEVLVSASIRDEGHGSGEVEFVDRGEYQLKGISEPLRLYAVVAPEQMISSG